MVSTKYGKLSGVDLGGYTEYRCVPYAKPPVGELRWREPQPPEAWNGVYEATEYASRCMVPHWDDSLPYSRDFRDNPAFDRPQSEDCLYLNIWVPNSGEKLPVAFWIHGGAFMAGFATEKEFDGKAYCDRGVILVSVEYRCNIFGFFAHPWLTAENPAHISGNYGMFDQLAALKWVYENIAAFGGDPENITIFGQSAGAMSVQTLVSSELTGNMAAKAIMQSGGSYGSGLHSDSTLAQQEEFGELFVELSGAKSLEELRAMSAEDITAAFEKQRDILMPKFGPFFAPTIDGKLLTDGYYRLMDAGKILDIPYMLGSTKDDIMVTPEMVKNGEFSPLYHGINAFSRKLEELGRNPAYVYYFTRDLPGDDFGAWHSSELQYMFGTLRRGWRPWEERDWALSERMLDYWINFMKTGDPNGPGLPTWQPHSEKNPVVLELC